MRIDELTDPVDDLDLALFGEPGKPAGEFADDLLLERIDSLQVDLRFTEIDPVSLHVFGFGDDLRGMQQRLRRNAADIQANAAEHLVALHEDDFLTEVRGAKGGRVTARPGAEHDDLGFDICIARRLRRGTAGRFLVRGLLLLCAAGLHLFGRFGIGFIFRFVFAAGFDDAELVTLRYLVTDGDG